MPHIYLRIISLFLMLMLYACSSTPVFKVPYYGPGEVDLATLPVPYSTKLKYALFAPIDIAFVGDQGMAFIANRPGEIYFIPNDETPVDGAILALDITDKVHPLDGEKGMYSVETDPNFEVNGYVYVSYAKDDLANILVVERYTYLFDNTIDPNSDVEVLSVTMEAPYHKGGKLLFDDSGMLLIGVGDGALQGDADGIGQNMQTLRGKMLRIDVSSLPYTIPADNPYAGHATFNPAIFASGLRHFWRFSIDSLTGTIWGGDVGHNIFEEIDKVVAGGNYGWPRYEGTADKNTSVSLTGAYTPPALPLAHESEPFQDCVVGGFVYRGAQLPSLYGNYVYGDCVSGSINAIEVDTVSNLSVSAIKKIAHKNSLRSFAEDNQGEIYVLSYEDPDGVYQLVEPLEGQASENVPRKLSETGFFKDTRKLNIKSFFQRYEVNNPLWSDGLKKTRWITLPEGSKIEFSATGAWKFPIGTIFIKHFETDNAYQQKHIETRVMFLHASGWAMYTYLWNEAQTNANLMTSNFDVTLLDEQGDDFQWTVPGTLACQTCHNASFGQGIGVRTNQLNYSRKWYFQGGVYRNQLDLWKAAGLFEGMTGEGEDYPSLVRLNEKEPSTAFVKSYLHSNCAHCHHPGGSTPSNIDFRFKTALDDMEIFDVAPSYHDFGVDNPRIIDPGSPSTSTLWLRLNDEGEHRMPALGSRVDNKSVYAQIRAWILD